MYTGSISKSSNFNWEHEELDQMKKWNQKFAAEIPIDGIYTNDFIVDKHDGVAYAIECNPRLGSQISLFHSVDNMANIILGKNSIKNIEPPLGNKTYTTLNDWFVLLDPDYYEDAGDISAVARFTRFLGIVLNCTDPIFDDDDLMPFFMINFFQIPMLLTDTFLVGRPWKKVDF